MSGVYIFSIFSVFPTVVLIPYSALTIQLYIQRVTTHSESLYIASHINSAYSYSTYLGFVVTFSKSVDSLLAAGSAGEGRDPRGDRTALLRLLPGGQRIFLRQVGWNIYIQ